MAVTEKQRLEFINKLREEWGAEHADTFMEMVPPTDWSHVATKADLASAVAHLASREFVEARLHEQTRHFVTWMLSGFAVQTAVIGILLVLT